MNNYPAAKARGIGGMLFTFSPFLQERALCKLLILVKGWLFDVKWHNGYLNWETVFHNWPQDLLVYELLVRFMQLGDGWWL